MLKRIYSVRICAAAIVVVLFNFPVDIASSQTNIRTRNLNLPSDSPLARLEHPRIFITKEMIPFLKQRCSTTHNDIFERMKSVCDSGNGQAIQLALCYLITDDKKYAEMAKEDIWRDSEQRPGMESIALDWIYDTLTKDEVREIGVRLLNGLWDSDHAHSRSGFREMVWWNQHYAYTFSETFMKDLFLYGEGIDDSAVTISLEEKLMCLKDCFIWGHNKTGGSPEGYEYFHTGVEPRCDWPTEAWRTATGEDLFQGSTFQKNRGAWYLYGQYPGGNTVGINDSRGLNPGGPRPTAMPLLGSRARDPICAWMTQQYVADESSHYGYGRDYWCFILWDDPDAPAIASPEELPTSHLFEGLGWASMKSAWTKDATFCFFMAGDRFTGHWHADAGSFILSSRGGYLAIDSGLYSKYQDDHMAHGTKYYSQGIAHNTMFIHDPHERSGGMWDRELRVRDNGGVLNVGNRPRSESESFTEGGLWDSANILAYEANSLFTYVAADLTGNYRRELDPFQETPGPPIIDHYTRQLLYLNPDVVIVYDRVVTMDEAYTKRFLLHQISKPAIQSQKLRQIDLGIDEFDSQGDVVVTDGNACMFVRTLLPEHGVIRRIGGVHVESIEKSPSNEGNGDILNIETLFGACSETITATCVGIRGRSNADFEVVSNVFGSIGTAVADQPFTDDPRHPIYSHLIKLDPHISFTIKSGDKPFAEGDTFIITLKSRRFWVQGENPEPSYKYWTFGGYCQDTLDSRRMGGWGRIEIEPESCSTEDHFLIVLRCTDGDVKEMPDTCKLIRADGIEGLELTQEGLDYRIEFNAVGQLGGHIKIEENDDILQDSPLATTVTKEISK